MLKTSRALQCGAVYVFSGMPCYSPITGYKSRTLSASGKRPIVFNRGAGYVDQPVTLPCGKCIGCRISHSRSWALRCVHESKDHLVNSFLTLTYSDENLPPFNTLVLDDLQRFFKRLRAKGVKFRYFACGEYGDSTFRPHYHVLLFGYGFTHDRTVIKKSRSGDLFTSKSLADTWGLGHVTIGNFSYQTAAYVSRYVLKKRLGADAGQSKDYTRLDPYTGEVVQVLPEFCVMSRNPGIGAKWFSKYKNDAFPDDFVVIEGKKFPIPKYYFNKFKEIDLQAAEQIKFRRKNRMNNSVDNTPDRLTVRENCALAKSNLKKRDTL